MNRLWLLGTVLLLFCGQNSGVPIENAPFARQAGDGWTACVIDDTQEYVAFRAAGDSACSEAQWENNCLERQGIDSIFDWCIANADVVVQVGDVMSTSYQGGSPKCEPSNDTATHAQEMGRAQVLFNEVLDADIPLLFNRGNHDTYYRWLFGFGEGSGIGDRMEAASWWGGWISSTGCEGTPHATRGTDPHNYNENDPNGVAQPDLCNDSYYLTPTLGGQTYLMFSVSCDPDPNEITEIQAIIDANPNTPVWLNGHEIAKARGNGNVYPGNVWDAGASSDPNHCDCGGEATTANVWDDLVKDNPEVLFVSSGHWLGSFAGWLEHGPIDPNQQTAPTTKSSGVLNINQNYQRGPRGDEGGHGWFTVVRLDPSRNRLSWERRSELEGRIEYRDFCVDDNENNQTSCIDNPTNSIAVNIAKRYGWGEVNSGLASSKAYQGYPGDARDSIGVTYTDSLTLDGTESLYSTHADWGRDPNAPVINDRAFLASMWFKCEAAVNDGCLLESVNEAGTATQYHIKIDTDTMEVYAGGRTLTEATDPCDGAWHNVTVKLAPDGDVNEVRAWHDGVEFANAGAEDQDVQVDFGTLNVGGCYDGIDLSNQFDGQIANLIFDGTDQRTKQWEWQPIFMDDAVGDGTLEFDINLRELDGRDVPAHLNLTWYFPFGNEDDASPLFYDPINDQALLYPLTLGTPPTTSGLLFNSLDFAEAEALERGSDTVWGIGNLWTIAFWLKFDSGISGDLQTYFDMRNSASDANRIRIGKNFAGDNLLVVVYDSTGTVQISEESSFILSDLRDIGWNRVTVTKSAAAVSLTVNGVNEIWFDTFTMTDSARDLYLNDDVESPDVELGAETRRGHTYIWDVNMSPLTTVDSAMIGSGFGWDPTVAGNGYSNQADLIAWWAPGADPTDVGKDYAGALDLTGDGLTAADVVSDVP